MDSDLVCGNNVVGLELTTGAYLDMNGHEITSIAGVMAGVGVRLTGTGARVSGGRITRCNVGISVSGGGHRISDVVVAANNAGIAFSGSSDNEVVDSDVSANRNVGISLNDGANRNRFSRLTVNDQAGTALIGGFLIRNSHENVVTESEIARNACDGILIYDASRNVIRGNSIHDSRCPVTPAVPAVNVALYGNSDENLIAENDVSVTLAPETQDGINVGCRDRCAFQPPSTGANGNVIRDNIVSDHARYGIAQEPGNTGNVFRKNVATGNGFADLALGADAPRGVHRVFVTSVSGNGNLATWPAAGGRTGLAAGDAICQARAKAAGLPGTFRAWLSDPNDDAYCRIHGFDGKRFDDCGQATLPADAGPWVRTDGYPFSAKLIDMEEPRNVIYTTARFDEFGNELPPGDRRYFTATWINGVVMADPWSCDGWTSTLGDISPAAVGGDGDLSAWGWSVAGDIRCSASARLLCFEVGPGAALGVFAETGKLAFVTSGEESPPDLATADGSCRARATAAGLPNAARFKAWLSDAQTDARDRLTSNGPWVRVDGIPVARSKADLLDGSLFAPLNVTELGTYVGEEAHCVRTGTLANGTAGSTSTSGIAFAADAEWTDAAYAASCYAWRLYCFED